MSSGGNIKELTGNTITKEETNDDESRKKEIDYSLKLTLQAGNIQVLTLIWDLGLPF